MSMAMSIRVIQKQFIIPEDKYFDMMVIFLTLRKTENSDLLALTANKRPNSLLDGTSLED